MHLLTSLRRSATDSVESHFPLLQTSPYHILEFQKHLIRELWEKSRQSTLTSTPYNFRHWSKMYVWGLRNDSELPFWGDNDILHVAKYIAISWRAWDGRRWFIILIAHSLDYPTTTFSGPWSSTCARNHSRTTMTSKMTSVTYFPHSFSTTGRRALRLCPVSGWVLLTLMVIILLISNFFQ